MKLNELANNPGLLKTASALAAVLVQAQVRHLVQVTRVKRLVRA